MRLHVIKFFENDNLKFKYQIRICCLIIAVFFSSCKDDETTGMQIVPTEKKILKIDNKVALGSNCFEMNEGKLYIMNRSSSAIDVFDWGAGQLSFSIPLNELQRLSVANVTGFKIMNDSTVIITSRQLGYTLIDLNGRIVSNHRFSESNLSFLQPPINTNNFRKKISLTPKGFYFSQVVPGDWKRYNQKLLNQVDLEKFYSFETKELVSVPIRFPENYLSGDRGLSFYHSRFIRDQVAYVNYSHSHQVGRFDLGTGKENFFDRPFKDKPFTGHSRSDDINSYLRSVCEDMIYHSILAGDSFIVRTGYEEEDSESLTEDNIYQLATNRTKPFLMILTYEDLDVLAKGSLDKDKYDLDMCLMIGNSIYIKERPQVTDPTNEDHLVFQKFELVEKL